MRPAVQILVGAGASILTLICRGKSALSVAYEYTGGQHPRQWAARYDLTQRSQTIVPGFDGTEYANWKPRNHELLWISESTDKEMLEILLRALRDRGEVVEEELDKIPISSKWELFGEKVYYLA
ncbi:hypothetical protein F5B21DRAFT_501414 [Xylaria acuta]|nr:hypothetical protein F5B21DRAFT_501414 [Xylaria acuta]